MDQVSLLAPSGASAPKQLRTDNEDVTVSFTELRGNDDERLLEAKVHFVGERYISVVYDEWLREVCIVAAPNIMQTPALVKTDLRRRGIDGVQRGARFEPEPGNGHKRRAAVVHSEDGTFSARARAHYDEEDGTFVRLRVETKDAGYRHTVIDARGTLIATASGKSDSDAWTRVRNELERQGYAMD